MQTTDPYNILIPIRLEEVDSIWTSLRNHRFGFAERTYAHFTAMRNGLHVTVYEKGPKMLVQGKGALDFMESVLGPLVAAGVNETGLSSRQSGYAE